ncbi:hypothetical protein CCR75_004607 [Bremia lactucae]|uniref:CHCH domain-containing protein n=1 Tax=Bremia lactucae TaxID=4779 RepID=A0A976IM73_BRELC|nr:hypothetical protein CCR75_004607 [Bremia lactucae]
MGADHSKPSSLIQCTEEMEAYVKCVEAKTAESGGLRDGEECEKESEAYRECRRMAKEVKNAINRQRL